MTKKDNGSTIYKRVFFALILLTLVTVSFLLVKPFLTAILSAMVFSYIFYPVYKRLFKLSKSKNIAALLTAILVVIILTAPLFFILNTISKDAYSTYLLTRQKIATGNYLPECNDQGSFVCRVTNSLTERANEPQFKYYVTTSVESATNKITDGISDILFSIPVFLIHSFIALFIMFFLFRDGPALFKKIEQIMPLKDKHRTQVLTKLNNMTYAVVYGSLIIAIIQGTLGAIGFFIFGIPAFLLWGIIMIFAALIPYIGTATVWLPASLYLIFTGYAETDSIIVLKGVLLLLYGIFVIGTIDNILKPKLIGDKGGLHPVLVLLGVVGGLQVLGFIGVLVGPIILALLVAFINIYEDETQYS